jgi:alkylation response protein AidB-like acyl-CoA dehydrogenase
MTQTTLRGGSFLIQQTQPAECFTPEDFSEESRLLAQTTREFIAGEVGPIMDRLETQEKGLMPALLRKAGEIGLLMADIPQAYGGLEVDKATSMLIVESMGRGGSFPVAHGAHTGIGTLPIVYFGTPQQKQQWLPRLACGEVLSSYALTETGSGSDALAAKAVARLAGEEWVLNGEKQFITNAGFADLFIVFAKIDGEQFTAFLVPRDSPGVSVGAEEKKMGIKGSSTRSLILQNARIPKDNLLGEAGKGHVIAFNILNVGRFKLGAGAVGGAKVALEDATRYASERVQFGRPIAQFPLIQGKLGSMAARIYGGESAVYRTAGLLDRAIAAIPQGPHRDREVIRAIEEFSIECSIIKVYGSEVLDFVADETVQIYGGYGYVADYPAERYYRDARINRIYEGTNEINRMIIPGMLLKRAMKGDLPLLAAAKQVQEALLAIPDVHGGNGSAADFGTESEQIEQAKKAILLVAGVAAQAYGSNLQGEQEVLAWVADMVMETYALESAVLRARKLAAAGQPTTVVRDMVAVLAYESVENVGRAGREALAHMSHGDDLRMQLAGLKRFSKPAAVDTAGARRRIAQAVVENRGYRVPA